jgi:hypothetical protein
LATVRVVVDPICEQDLVFQTPESAHLRHIYKRSPAVVLKESDTVAAADEELWIAVLIKVLPEPKVRVFNRA